MAERQQPIGMAGQDRKFVADLLGHRSPLGLWVAKAVVGEDEITVTYKLRDGFTWGQVR